MNAMTPKGSGGGGGKGPRAPYEAPNTLRAKQLLRMVYLVSEGPCAGFPDAIGGKCIYFDDTPLVSNDGTANFTGVRFEVRDGSAGQEPFSGIPINDSATTTVGAKVTKSGGPITRVVDCTGYDRIRITMGVNALFKVDTSTSEQTGTAVTYAVTWRQSGTSNPFQELYVDTIDGKCVAPYARAKTFQVPFAGQIDVRITRITDDSASSSLQNDIFWTSYSTILDQKLSYPGSALVALELDQEQFQSGLPVVTFRWKGLLCSVPDIYDPVTATYTGGAGAWTGTFAKKYTNNPAWILYTLLTDPDWGCGNLIAGTSFSASKWLFHQIAQYCDEGVDNGFGGIERRYTFNTWIDSRDEALRVAASIASAFRGMLYWGAGSVVPVADMPGPIVKDVNPSNTVDGRIEYEGSSIRARHSVVKVMWRDPVLEYRQTIEVVEDPELIQLFGVREVEYEAIGCTSRGLARRMGRWVLYSEKFETKIARYSAGLDHANVRPGELIAIQDPGLAGVVFSGRLAQLVDASTLKLDRDVTLSSGETYQLRIALPDGSMSSVVAITNTLPTTTRDITTALPMPTGNEPEPGAIWTIIASNVAPVTYRVIQVEEDTPQVYTITALQHHSGKYAAIETGLALDDDPYTIFRPYASGLGVPTNPTAVEFLTGTGATSLVRVDFSWTPPVNDPRVTAFEAQALLNGSVVRSEATVLTTVTFADLPPGSYVFQVRSLGDGGLVSGWAATSTIAVDGLADPPPAPVGLVASAGIRAISVRWNAPTDRLFRDAEIHASSNSTFGAGGVVGRINGREFIHTGLLPNATWYYWVRFWNTLGQASSWIGPVNATTSLLVAADIQDAILNTAKFASSIAPVGLVSSVPGSRVFDNGRALDAIFNTTDGKLYRWNGTAYTSAVETVDLTGTLTAGTFPAGLRPIEVVSSLPSTGNFEGRLAFLTTDDKIYRHTGSAWVSTTAAADITGTITDAQIAAVAASKLTGVLDAARFSTSLRPVEVVATLPSTGNFEGRMAFLTTDDKLYRYTGSAWVSTVPAADVTGALTNSQIADLDAAKLTGSLPGAVFPNSLRPVEVVATLPSTGNFEGRLAFLTTDDKLYRHTGSAWVSTTAAADITGTLADAQIAAVAAAKVTGQLTNAQLADLAATKITGQLTNAQIADLDAAKLTGSLPGAVFSNSLRPIEIVATLPSTGNFEGRIVYLTTDDKLYRHTGSAWVSTTAAADITGTLADAQIAAVAAAKVTGQLTNAQIADLAAAKVTGQITDAQIAAVAAAKLTGTLDAARFSNSLRPVEVVATLPSSGNFEGRMVFLTTDDKLYRHTGSAWVSTVPAADVTGTLTNSQIADLDAAKLTGSLPGAVFPNSLRPVEVVATLPSTGNFEGRLVYLTTDDKLYRHTGSAWVSTTAAADITGTLADAQIAALAASKVTGTLTNTQIADLAAAKITGQITDAQIAAVAAAKLTGTLDAARFSNSLRPIEVVASLPSTGNFEGRMVFLTTDDKLYRHTGSAWVSTVPAADVTGTLTNAQIADLAATKITGQITTTQITDNAITTAKVVAGAITTGKIAAGAVTAAEIAAGTITATQIASGAITTAKLAAGAVTANELAANAVIAGKIAAGAITATEISAGAIIASKLAILDTTNLVQNPGFSFAGVASLDGWIGAAAALAASDPEVPAGAPGAFVAKRSATTVQGDITAGDGAYFPMAGGEAFNIDFWAASSVDCVHSLTAGMRVRNGAGIAGLVQNSAIAPNGGVWTRYTYNVVLPPTVSGSTLVDGRFYFRVNGNPAPAGAWYFSNVRVRRAANAEMIVDGAVTANKITASAVTTAKLDAGAVTTAKLAAGAVTANEIATNAITAVKIDAGAVTTAKIAAGAVTAAEIAALTITAAQIAAGTITATQIATDAITAAKIQAGAVTAGKIAANAVTATEIAADAVTAVKILAGSVTTAKIAAGAVTAAEIAAGTITATQIASGAITTAKLAAGAVTANELAANAVVAGKIAAGAITATEISANAITASKLAILDTTNIVQNPGFSFANAASSDGWINIDAALAASAGEVPSGAPGAFVGRRVGGAAAVDLTANSAFFFPMAPGEAFNIDFWAASTADCVHELSAGFRIVAASGSSTPNSQITITAPVTTWTRYTLNYIAPATVSGSPVVSARFFFRVGANASPAGAWYITSVRVRRAANAEMIVDGAVTANKITASAVTTAKLDAAAVTTAKLAAGAVTANEIAANAITAVKIEAGAVTTAKIAAGAVTAAEIAALTITAAQIAAGTITATQIATDAITAAKIQAGAVTAGKIAANAVTATEIAADAVTAVKILAGSVTTAKIAANAVTANEVAANAITAVKIDAGAVTTAKLAAGAVTANEIAANAITAVKIDAGAVTTAKIAAGAVTAAEIAALTITAAQIAAGTITATQIATDAITAAKIQAGAVTAGKIAANAVTATEIAADAVTAVKILAGSVTTAKIAANAVTANEIAANAITAGKILAGAVEAGKIAANAVTATELAANAVVAGKIAAGAITATEIAAGAITASRLAVVDTTNLIQNGAFTYDNSTASADGWTNLAASLAYTESEVPSGAPGKFVGKKTLTSSVVATLANSGVYAPVTPGETFFYDFWAAPGTGANQSLLFSMAYLSNSGASNVMQVTIATTSTGWNRYTGHITVPATTAGGATILAVPNFRNAGGGSPVGAWYFTNVKLRRSGNAEMIVDGAVTADKIFASAVTAAKIDAGAVTTAKLAAGAVTANEIAANTITAAKIVSGTITATELASNSVTAAKIASGSVTAAKLAANSVVAGKVAANAITAGTIAANAVTAGTIAAGAVSATEIAANAITSGQLATSTLITLAAQLGSAVVGTAQIQDAAISTAKIGNAQITNAKIGDLQVDTIKVVDGSISSTTGGTYTSSGATAGSYTEVLAVNAGDPSFGTRLLIQASVRFDSFSGYVGGDNGSFRIRRQDGTIVWETAVLDPGSTRIEGVALVIDTTSPGYVGYYLDFKTSGDVRLTRAVVAITTMKR